MFSVIIPLYNKAETIERAIASVLAQTERAFELIVVDDGSTDRGAEIVRSIPDPRIRLIQQANGGVSKARNTGIEAAKYDYVTFLDADDEYLPEFLKTMRKLIEKYPQAGIYGTSYCFQYPDGTQKNPLIRGIPDHFEGILDNYFEVAANSAPPLWTGSVCIRKDAIMDIGKFPVGVVSGEDLLTWAKLAYFYPLVYSAGKYAVYHTMLGNQCPPRIPPEKDIVGEELFSLYDRSHEKGIRLYLARWHKIRGVLLLCFNLRKRSVKELLIALKFDFWNIKIWAFLFFNLLPEKLLVSTVLKKFIPQKKES